MRPGGSEEDKCVAGVIKRADERIGPWRFRVNRENAGAFSMSEDVCSSQGKEREGAIFDRGQVIEAPVMFRLAR